MPHQIIEYSANLPQWLNIDELVDALHHAAAGQEALPIGGLRTRAYPAEQYQIADGHPDNAFIAVYLRLGEGRKEELLETVGRELSHQLFEFVKGVLGDHPIALSFEIQEIDLRKRWNDNNMREHITRRETQGEIEDS